MRTFLLCILSIFMTFAYCEGVLPEGEGTQESPFLIETLDNLRYISENSTMWVDMYYLQTADIDATATQNWNSGLGFKPLGQVLVELIPDDFGHYYPVDVFYPFNSYYDGANHSISNLFINRADDKYIAFISNQSSGYVQNLNLIDADISGFRYVGGLVGSSGTLINNCSVTGNVYSYNRFAGGIASCLENGTISNSSFVGNVEAVVSYASLLVYKIAIGTISNCAVEGSVTASDFAAGIFTQSFGEDLIIEDCSINVDITCPGDMFGVFSIYHNELLDSGWTNYEYIKNTFFSSDSSINNSAFNVFGSLSPVEFSQWISNDKVFDPTDYYFSVSGSFIINSNEDLEKLKYFYNRGDLNFQLNSDLTLGTSTLPPVLCFNSSFDGNNHTISNLTIESSGNFVGLFGRLGSECQISNLTLDNFNISANDCIGCLAGVSMAQVSHCSVVNSSVNGNNYLSLLVGDYLFGVNIDNCSVNGSLSGNNYIGGIIARSSGYNSLITNCSSNATITGNINVGGLAGSGSSVSFQNCESQGSVSGNINVGGIAGNGNVINSWSNATVTGVSNVGGIIGTDGSVNNSAFTGSVTGGNHVGGIAGSMYESYFCSISNSFSEATVQGCNNVGGIIGYVTSNFFGGPEGFIQINNCYSKSEVISVQYPDLTIANIGGFVGKSHKVVFNNCYTTSYINTDSNASGGFSAHTSDQTHANNCFWSSELSGQSSSASATNVTAEQLQNQDTFTDAGWDFDTVWYLSADLNNGYPLLRDALYTENADDEEIPEIASATFMKAAYPNPFNPETTIDFFVDNKDLASLTIYNLKGQVVKSYSSFLPGEHKVIWKGLNNDNQQVSSGLYLYRLESKHANVVKKMVLMK